MRNEDESSSRPLLHAPAQATFRTVGEGVIDQFAVACSNWAARAGTLELFQRSRTIPGFSDAEASWKAACEKTLGQLLFPDSTVFSEKPTMRTAPDLFFCKFRVQPEAALKMFAPLIFERAGKGDVGFFKKMGSEMRKSERRIAAEEKRGAVPFFVHTFWIHGCLWLMSDVWGSRYLEYVLGRHGEGLKVSQNAYTKARERLGLVNWQAGHTSPRIVGFNKRTGKFSFADGWTDLEPSVSR